jgi:hypothetical protein
MQKIVHFIFLTILILPISAQNLVTNPGAESLPRGTGWTIVSQGALTCLSAPTNNYLNWTMKPDGSANYPYDHTTGSSGGTIFYSGCDTYFTGPFELQQTVDVSTDAASIDAGNQLYTFSGYMQTPVSNQTDQGRFIVDFLNASNVILGTSYTSNWQSFYLGSGTSWINYSNTRIAPVGTRKIKIRMQTEIHINQPAINVYFDDISLTKPSIVPLGILDFTGSSANSITYLDWTIAAGIDCRLWEVEQSNDGIQFKTCATFPGGKTSYHFVGETGDLPGGQEFFRLKMTTTGKEISYSKILVVHNPGHSSFTVYPNPARNIITISGLQEKGRIALIHSSGKTVMETNATAAPCILNISFFPAGLYVLRFSSGKTILYKKLVIRPS